MGIIWDELQELANEWKKQSNRSFGNEALVLEFCANELEKWIEIEGHLQVLLDSWRENARTSAGGLPEHLNSCADELENILIEYGYDPDTNQIEYDDGPLNRRKF
jgi:hypothetical protein